MVEALALLELDSVARGLRAVDALVKQSPVRMHEANLVEPGKFLLLFSGGVAEVEEARARALEVAGDRLIEELFLPVVHPGVVRGLEGWVEVGEPDAVGIVEGRHVAGVVEACDRSLKEAEVELCGLRLAGGLGGRAYYVLRGPQHMVEAGLEAGQRVLERRGTLHQVELIANPHPEFVEWLLRPPPFAPGRFSPEGR